MCRVSAGSLGEGLEGLITHSILSISTFTTFSFLFGCVCAGETTTQIQRPTSQMAPDLHCGSLPCRLSRLPGICLAERGKYILEYLTLLSTTYAMEMRILLNNN